MAIEVLTADQLTQQIIGYVPTNWVAPIELTPKHLTYAVYKGLGYNDEVIMTQLQFIQQQLSLLTATGTQIDLIAKDYFGANLPRFANEMDVSYISRILGRMFVATCTRTGFLAVIEKTVGSGHAMLEQAVSGEYFGGYMDSTTLSTAIPGPLAYDTQGTYLFAVPPYTGWVYIQQLEPTATGFLTKAQITALVEMLKPYGTLIHTLVIGPASTGGVPI